LNSSVDEERYVLRKPVVRDLVILLAFTAITVLALLQLGRIEVDGSIDAFLPTDHSVVATDEEIESTFGSLDSMIAAVSVTFGTVLEPEVIALIDEMTKDLESQDSVDSVTSLSNIDYVTSDIDQMTVVPLIENLDADGIRETSRRITDWQEAYVGTIVSEDLKTTAVVVQPRSGATSEEQSAIYTHLRLLADEHENANLRIRVVGPQVYDEEITLNVAADVRFLIPAAAALVVLVLAISFRRLLGVLCPMLSIAVAGLWVVGLIGALGITLTMATLLVPVLLLVVGSAYGIHVMQHFYEDLSHEEGYVSYDRVREIIRQGVGAIRRPVLLAGITTAAGFVAQLTSPLGPFRVFGVLSAAGIAAALLTSLVLIPVLLRLVYRGGIDLAAVRAGRASRAGGQRRLPGQMQQFVARRKSVVLGVTLALAVATGFAIPRIQVGTNVANFFRPSSRVASDTREINATLGGTGIISVAICAPEPGDILRPEFLTDLQSFETFLTDRYPAVTGVRTVVPSIRRINSIMNYGTVPYSVTEPEELAFDFFADGGFFGESGDVGAPTEETAEDDFFFAFGTSSDADGEPVLDQSDDEEATGGTNEAVLSYDEVAAMLESALLEAGVDANLDEIIGEFLAEHNFHGSAFDEIPQDPAKYGLATTEELHDLITQYLVLYSGNLDMFINDALEPDQTLVTVQLNDESRDVLVPLRQDIAAYWDYHLPDGWRADIGGHSTRVLVLSELVTRSQYLSLAGALIIVWAIVAITFRSPLAGIFGLIPVLFALSGIFLSMAVFGFHLDVVTSILAALAIGIGVDYGIHLMSAYRRGLAEGHSNLLEWVYRRTGSAILFNAASVAVGFLALLVSHFVPIQQVGILFTVSMVFAGAASLVVLPMALEYFSPDFITRGVAASAGGRRKRRLHEIDYTPAHPVTGPAADSSGSGGNGRGDHAERAGQPERRELGDGHPDDADRSERLRVDSADPDPCAR
jgi:predicted RND superfamily exporter protein